MGAPMTSKTGPATPQFGGTKSPVQVGSQMLGGTVTPNTQWGSGQSMGGLGGGYKPMPFNVNMGQGLGTAAQGGNGYVSPLGQKMGVSVGTTLNTMMQPRPADYGMNMLPPTMLPPTQTEVGMPSPSFQGTQTPGIMNGQSFGQTGPGLLPTTRQFGVPGDVGMVQTGKTMSKAQQLAHVLKGMGG